MLPEESIARAKMLSLLVLTPSVVILTVVYEPLL
jgi:hypothetical protein